MKHKRKATLIISITLGLILLTEILVGQFFSNLTFVNVNLTIANRIICYFSFSGFILYIPIFFKVTKTLTIPLGVILLLLFFINSYAEIFPIDTTTQPKDIVVLQTNKDGSKLIVRELINAKTNGIIRDTALVKDNFIFRELIKSKK